MVALKSVSLNDLKVYENWKNAPVGALLQTYMPNGEAVAGLRCQHELGHGRYGHYFLALEGNHRGVLLEDKAIRQYALDVSSSLEIRVSEISPMRFAEPHGDLYGTVCEHGAGTGHFCVHARSIGGVRGYVWLSDPVKGRLETDNLQSQLIVIGMTDTAEIKRGDNGESMLDISNRLSRSG